MYTIMHKAFATYIAVNNDSLGNHIDAVSVYTLPIQSPDICSNSWSVYQADTDLEKKIVNVIKTLAVNVLC